MTIRTTVDVSVRLEGPVFVDHRRGAVAAVRIVAPGGVGTVEAVLTPRHRTMGDDRDGRYSTRVTLPEGPWRGDWVVAVVTLTDAVGDEHRLLTADLVRMGVSTSFRT